MINKYNDLVSIINRDAVTYGDFTLSSGKRSDKYIDLRKVSLSSHGSALIAMLIIDKMENIDIDAVGGPTIGADPIIGSIISLSYMINLNASLGGFLVRKEAKEHGMQNRIEGNIKAWDRVVLVDDVVTSGNSLYDAVKCVEEAGCNVVKIIPVLDRCEGGKDIFLASGYNYDPVLYMEGDRILYKR